MQINLLNTIKKELRSVFRDKKTIIMILAFPLMIGVLIFLYGFMDTEVVGTESTKYKIGINYEPTEVEKIYLDGLDGLYLPETGIVTYNVNIEELRNQIKRDIECLKL